MRHATTRALRKLAFAWALALVVLAIGVSNLPAAFAMASTSTPSTVPMPPQLLAALQREGNTQLLQARLVSIKSVYVPVSPATSAPSPSGTATPYWWCGCYEIHNERVASDGWWSFLRATTATNPTGGQLTLSISQRVSNSRTNNAGVSTAFINGQLGFNTSGDVQVTDSDTVNVPDNGTTWQLAAYAGMNVFTYDVYYNPVVGGSYYVATDQAFQYDGIVHFVEEQIS